MQNKQVTYALCVLGFVHLVPTAGAGIAEASPAHDALAPKPGGLTADQCVRRALQIAPSLQAARGDIAEQKANTLQVMADYVPDLSLQASYRRTSPVDVDFGEKGVDLGASGIDNSLLSAFTFEQPRNNYGVQATLALPLSEYAWQIVPALRAARSNEAAARYRKQAQALRVTLSAQMAYYRWLRAVATVAVSKQAIAGAQARLADARRGFTAGTLAEVDVLRLESLVGSAQLALNRADSERRIAEHNLQLLTGLGGPFVVGEDLFQRGPTTRLPVDRLIARGKKQRPDARALARASDAARNAAKRSFSEYFPHLEAVGSVNYANPNQLFFPPTDQWNVNWSVALNLTWSVSRFMRGIAQVRRFKANERSLRAQLEQLWRAVAQQVRSSWHRWRQAATSLNVNAKKLRAAEAAYEQMQRRYAAGLSTTTDVIDAENARNQAALDEIDARIDLRTTHAQLLNASGYAQLTKGTLGKEGQEK